MTWLTMALWAGAMGWGVATAVLALITLRRAPLATTETPGVSVVVPVASPAPDLVATVSSLIGLDYPTVEILLCADADDAEAVRVIESEAERHGGRVRALALALPATSFNSKPELLAAAVEQARHDILLLGDDNVVSSPDRIRTHLAQLESGCALVSSAVVGTGGDGLWSAVDAAFMNGGFARLQLAGAAVGFAGVIGKSLMMRRDDLARSGGLRPTGTTVCEDAELRRRMAKQGGRVGLATGVLAQPLGARAAADVWARHKRWFFCRSQQVPGVFALEILLSAPLVAIAGAVVAPLAGMPWWLGAIGSLALLAGTEAAFLRLAKWPVGRWFAVAWLVRESLVLPIACAAVMGGTVAWRRRTIKLA